MPFLKCPKRFLKAARFVIGVGMANGTGATWLWGFRSGREVETKRNGTGREGCADLIGQRLLRSGAGGING